MKRIILTIVFANIVVGLFAQSDFFYSSNGGKEWFKIRKDKVLIKAKSSNDAKKISKHADFKFSYDLNNLEIFATIDTLSTNIEKLRQSLDLVDVSYWLEYADGTLQAPTNQIFIKTKKGITVEQVVDKIGLTKNIESIRLINPEDGIYLLTLNVKINDILLIVRKLYETGLTELVEPSFLRQLKLNNTYYSQQWGLKDGISGIDIKAEQAWTITRGSNNIRVAVIDDGVDLTHPDLQANLLTGFDATVNPPGGANGSPFGNDAHGTACAGIIAAIDNTIGVVGVTPNSRIIPVRIAYKLLGSSYWVSSDTWIINGIRFAWQTANADVLSNSWGEIGSNSDAITSEINNAVTNGRSDNCGCVVVFASGNNDDPDDSEVSYPASLPNVIAVGAITRNGQRTNLSNYGNTLDVVAPGADIYTTDIQGSAGYNTASGTAGNYYSSFGGTSAACPHVAGVAALILSVRPDLTQAQVRHIIESTCTKLSGYSFSNNSSHPNGTWNEEVGHGLVNAYAAVSYATSTISGPTNVCSSGNTFTINNLPANITDTQVTWSYSDNIQPQGGNNGINKTFVATGHGEGWVGATVNGIELTRVNVGVGTPAVSFSLVSGSTSPCPSSILTLRIERSENAGPILDYEEQFISCTSITPGGSLLKKLQHLILKKQISP